MRARPLSLPHRATLLPLLAAAGLGPFAARLPAQNRADGDRLTATAIHDLAEPSRAAEAAAILVRIGQPAVPALVRLIDVPQRYAEPPERVLNALYVLGRLGELAQEAVPSVLRAADAREPAIAGQASWALGEIGQHLSLEERQRIARQCQSPLVERRLELGARPATPTALEWLRSDDPDRVLAAALVLRPPFLDAVRRDDADRALGPLLRQRLEEALQPAALPWDAPPLAEAAAELAAACIAVDAANADAQVGRGLLRHWDALLRRRGVGLVQGLQEAPLPVRAELLAVLFDRDAELRQLAAATFGAWGRGGLCAILPLRRLAVEDEDVGMRMACQSAIAGIVKGCGSSGAFVVEIEQRAGQAAAGAMLPPLRVPCAEHVPLLAELLAGAEWTGVERATALFPHPEDARPAPPALERGVLRFLANTDGRLRDLAAAWVVRHGCPTLPEPERAFCAAARFTGARDANLVEALVFVQAGANAPVAALRDALHAANARLVVRAAAELLRRGERQLPAPGELLQPDREWRVRMDGGTGESWQLPDVDLASYVHAMARLLLVAGGAAGDGTAAAAFEPDPLRRYVPPNVADPAAWLGEDAARVVRVAAAIERDVQDVLHVTLELAPR